MKAASLFPVLSLLLIFSSCNKEKSVPTAPVDPSGSPGYSGVLIASSYTYGVWGPMQTRQGAQARFYRTTNPGLGPANDVKLKRISVNGIPLLMDETSYFLPNSEDPIDLSVDTWSITSADAFPSFTFKNEIPFPACKDIRVIPDTISKSKGASFLVEDVTNSTTGSLQIMSGLYFKTYTISVGTNNIEIKPSDLNGFIPDSMATINLWMKHNQDQWAGGRRFQFSKEAYLYKKLVVVP